MLHASPKYKGRIKAGFHHRRTFRKKPRSVCLFHKLKGMNTLLIDDDEWIRGSMSLLFEGEGCPLRAVETAEDGIEKLKTQNYDIIIVDYRLPGMDGLDFLGKIRDSHPHALTFLITAYGSKSVFSKASELGVKGFIDKPFTMETLEEALSRVIARQEGSSS